MASKKRTVKTDALCSPATERHRCVDLQELEVHETQIEEDAIQSMRHMLQASEAEPLQALNGSCQTEVRSLRADLPGGEYNEARGEIEELVTDENRHWPTFLNF